MKKVLCLALALITMLSLTVLPASAAGSSGSCGSNVYWSFNSSSGLLTISGSGIMDDYYSSQPWYSYRNNITKISVQSGVTKIGAGVFSDLYYLTSVTIANSVTVIGKYAFEDCDALTSITLPEKLNTIDDYAFADCSKIKSVTIPAAVKKLGEGAFLNVPLSTCYVLSKDVTFGNGSIGYEGWVEFGILETEEPYKCTFYGYPGSTTETYCEDEGYSFYDDIDYFTFKSLVLSAPKPSSAKNGKGYVTFKWEAVSGADSYLVYHKEGSGSWVQLGTTTSTSFKDTKVTSGKKYTYTVKAHNKYGYGSYNKTGVVSGYTNAPVLKSATASSAGITVKWNAVTGATGYNIYRKAPGASSWTKIGTATTTSYTDKTVKYNTSYTYTVIATVKFDGKTYNSTYDSTGLTAKASKMPTPSTPTAAVTKKGTVTVKWEKVTGATKYTVYRSEKADSGFKALKTVTSTSYADTTVKFNKTYYYKVVAYIGSAKSAASKACSIKATIPVPAVKNYVAVTTSSTKLYWDKVADATGYYIYRRVPGGSWSKIATIKKNSTVNYTDKTKGTFDYLICSYLTTGGKTYKSANSSAIRSVNLAAPKLTAEVADVDDFQVKLSWKKVANATSYQVYRKIENGSWALFKTVDAKTLSLTASNPHLKQYYWKVRAVSKNNGINSISSYSNTEDMCIVYTPNLEFYMPEVSNTTSFIGMYVTNNGPCKVRIYTDAYLHNPGCDGLLDSSLTLIKLTDNAITPVKYIDIPAYSEEVIMFYIENDTPWQDAYSRCNVNFKYDTCDYTTTVKSGMNYPKF